MKFPITLHILLLFVAALFFTACEKDNMDEIVVDEPEYTPEEVEVNNLFNALRADNSSGTVTMNCVTLETPFELELASGAIVTINNNADLEAAMEEDAVDPAVDFVYPISIVDAKGESAQVSSNKELGINFASCLPQQGWTAAMSTNETLPACFYGELFCVEQVYPVDLIDGEGNTYSVTNDDELVDLFLSVYSDSTSLAFILPISVINEAGEEVEIETVDEFFSVVGECENVEPVIVGDGFEAQGFLCYELKYPAEMLDTDGNPITVNSADEYANLVLGGEALTIEYPFTLESMIDGTTVTVNNFEEFILALNVGCGVDIVIDTTTLCEVPGNVLLFLNRGGSAQSPCRFNINYPVDVIAGGTTFTLNESIDYWAVYNDFNLNEIEVVYPVTVTVNSSGEVLEFTSDNDLCTYIEDCN
ncbi:MAG: hypothetical protein GVY26_09235 [Bacteroidetes bacterium]|jgi:hypothetical protein|nr:hypothetical protein [Bacteroidota bacterium]